MSLLKIIEINNITTAAMVKKRRARLQSHHLHKWLGHVVKQALMLPLLRPHMKKPARWQVFLGGG
jgi:hypothetical protein